MEKKINVFVKPRTNKTTNQPFNTYLSKGKDDHCYKVVFTKDCENMHLIPNNKKAFVLVTDSKKLSTTSKVQEYEGREVIQYKLYVNSISRIEEYEDEGIGDDIF